MPEGESWLCAQSLPLDYSFMMLHKTKSIALVLAVIALGGAGADCDFMPDEDDSCGDAGIPSVRIKITGEADSVVPFADVRYRFNSTTVVDFACDGTCGEVLLAFDTVGRFDITLRAPGYERLDRTIFVKLDEDDCHPDTEDWVAELTLDDTVGALAGAWYTANVYGESVLRFGDDGEIIGAILYDRQAGGDGNFYIAYNGNEIRGASGQQTQFSLAPAPTRTNDKFDFETTTLSFPIGFSDATMSDQHRKLSGSLTNIPVFYTRLKEIPEPLRDPE